jgi:hypothetical protein
MALGVVAALPQTIPSGHQEDSAGGDLFPHCSRGIYEEHTKQSTYQEPEQLVILLSRAQPVWRAAPGSWYLQQIDGC